jgi:zinc/manganese transport system permease protein
VGALLLLGLIAAPAGAAHSLATSPYRSLALSGLFAVIAVWGGLALSYAISSLPPSSAIIAIAATIYIAAAARQRLRTSN